MKKVKNDIALGCVSFVIEQLCFDRLSSKKNNTRLLTEFEYLFFREIVKLVKMAYREDVFSFKFNKTTFQFFALLLLSYFKPEKFLTFLDAYAVGMPYSKHARSKYCQNQIEKANEPLNLVFLGAGLDIKWVSAFNYDKVANRLIHKNSRSDAFEIILIDNSEKQNEILREAFKNIFGELPENIKIQTLDLKSSNWAKNLPLNNKIKTRFHANGLLPYFNDGETIDVITECFSLDNSYQFIFTLLVESKNVQKITSQSSARKIQEESSNQGEQLLFSFENIDELKILLNKASQNIKTKLDITAESNIIFDAKGLVEAGRKETYIYTQSEVAKQLSQVNIEPEGEVLVFLKMN
ncbi:MAG TPA: hypothetical protein DIV86_00790 [Alphaproteobacteria bacterium]|nr:hypothetical protein [Alphaproteobacteria bacterium]